VRDLLHVADLVDAMLAAHESMPALAGEAFNIGGGPDRTTSLVELVDTINGLRDEPLALYFGAWREADQRYYVSDTRRFGDATGWTPTVGVNQGIRALYHWLRVHTKAPAALAS
jgi:CDP-paratose 2-epimerase